MLLVAARASRAPGASTRTGARCSRPSRSRRSSSRSTCSTRRRATSRARPSTSEGAAQSRLPRAARDPRRSLAMTFPFFAIRSSARAPRPARAAPPARPDRVADLDVRLGDGRADLRAALSAQPDGWMRVFRRGGELENVFGAVILRRAPGPVPRGRGSDEAKHSVRGGALSRRWSGRLGGGPCDRRRDVARGEQLYELCAQCHGEDGAGSRLALAPAIAGLPEWFVPASCRSSATAAAAHTSTTSPGMRMRPMSRGLADRRRRRGGRGLRGEPAEVDAARRRSTGGNAETGKQKYTPCIACHGMNGEGNQALNAPPLAGTSDWYQLTSLQQVQGGRARHRTRRTPPAC